LIESFFCVLPFLNWSATGTALIV